jgi:hypothetical protein
MALKRVATMAETYLIVDPVGHRECEAQHMRETQRLNALKPDVEQNIEIFMILDADDGWWCDHCDRPIDLAEGPIVSVNNSALCHRCAPEHLHDAPRTPDGASVFLPVCACSACLISHASRTALRSLNGQTNDFASQNRREGKEWKL